jgi:CDP-diacylglycerol---serine O-phosphatidyltransferase
MKKKLISKIPNFFTILNAGFGLLAIIFAFENVGKSITLIILAMIADFFDGWVARKYKVSSELGKELDSLADTVSFVIAPAILTYLFFSETPWLATAVGIFIVGCGILRLATFNIQASTKFFKGLPTPLFTILIIGLLYSSISLPIWAYALLIFFGAYLMISPIKYPSFKDRQEVKVKYLTGLAIGLIIISSSLFSRYTFILVEYLLLFLLVLLPILLNKNYRKLEIGFFLGGAIVLGIVFYNNLLALTLMPLFYTPFALPLIEKARS